MVIKGGVFDKITDNKVLAELCGAKWIDNVGNSRIWFPVLDNDFHVGMKLYKTIQEKAGMLRYATCETSAYVAKGTLHAYSLEV